MMTESQTKVLLAALKTLDPQGWVDVGEGAVMMWIGTMNRHPTVPFDAAMHAAAELVARPGAKFPTPGDFRGIVAEVVCGIPTVEDARRQIERAMRMNYPGMPVKYTPDRIVLDAVRPMGGIHVFRVSQSERDTAGLWRTFMARYTDLRAEAMDTADVAASWAQLASGETPRLRALS